MKFIIRFFQVAVIVTIYQGCYQKNSNLDYKLRLFLNNGYKFNCTLPRVLSHEIRIQRPDYTGGSEKLINRYNLIYLKDTFNIKLSTVINHVPCDVAPDEETTDKYDKMYMSMLRTNESKNLIFRIKKVIIKENVFSILYYENGVFIHSCINGVSFEFSLRNTNNKELMNEIINSFKLTN
jgi:hypothetical protein